MNHLRKGFSRKYSFLASPEAYPVLKKYKAAKLGW